MENNELFQQAQDYITNKQYQRAQFCLEQLYLQKKNFRNNYYLVCNLNKLAQHQQAYQIAQEYLPQYLEDDELLLFYLNLGFKAKQIIALEQLMLAIRDILNDKINLFWQEQLAKYQLDNQIDLARIKKDFKYLGSLRPFEQRGVLMQAYQLTGEDFVEISRMLLLDSDVHQLIKVQILEDLAKLGVTEINYRNIWQETITVNLHELKSVEQTDQYLYYQTKFFDDSMRLQEIYLKLTLLYPDFSKIDDYSTWQHVLLNDQQVAQLSNSLQKVAQALEEQLTAWIC